MKLPRLTQPFLLLVLTVIVPSTGMVWMMREAMRNERLASEQLLRDAYQSQLQSASKTLVDRWNSQPTPIPTAADPSSASTAFADLVGQGIADSVLITDGQRTLLYPRSADRPSPSANELSTMDSSTAWADAQRLEFTDQKYVEAAQRYRQVAENVPDETSRALAQQAEVRCLIQADRVAPAILVLDQLRQQPTIMDRHGRSIAASAELRLLQLLDRDSPRWNAIADQLIERLNSYDDDSLISSQRLFFMSEVQRWLPDRAVWPTQAAETLAAKVIADDKQILESNVMRISSLPDVWVCPTSDRRVIELYRTETLRQRLLDLTNGIVLPPGIGFAVSSPGEIPTTFMDTSLGTALADWRLGLSMSSDLFAENLRNRRTVHLWIAVLVVVATGALTWMLAITLRRRMRLADLKNDLVATVSHELKTPLASIRLLVDTLLQSDAIEQPLPVATESEQTNSSKSGVELREYLQLISQENARLTRLIDQFLTFSRLEQRSHGDDFRPVDIRDIIEQSKAIFLDHWREAEEALVVDPLPTAIVDGDQDGLISALVNLLENAWKYSDDPKQITIGCHVEHERVFIVVGDNGIGLRPKDADRVFDQFFQVDQRVSRTRGGCGLGLSIVKGIAQAHGGTVTVESSLGSGSRFTLELPFASCGNAKSHTDTSASASPKNS